MKKKYYLRGLGIGIIVTAILMSVTMQKKTTPMSDDEIRQRARELGMEDKYETTVLSQGVSANTAKQETKAKDETKPIKDSEAELARADEKRQEENKNTETALDKPKKDAGQLTDSKEEPKEMAEEPKEKAEEPKEKAEEATEKTEKPKEKAEELEEIKTDDEAEEESADASLKTEKDKQDTNKQTQNEKQEEATEKTEKAEAADNETKKALEKTYRITVAGGDGSYTVAKKLEQAGMIEDAAAFDRFLCANGYDRKICVGEHTFQPTDDHKQIAENLIKKP